MKIPFTLIISIYDFTCIITFTQLEFFPLSLTPSPRARLYPLQTRLRSRQTTPRLNNNSSYSTQDRHTHIPQLYNMATKTNYVELRAQIAGRSTALELMVRVS
jgi:hypothetical protein